MTSNPQQYGQPGVDEKPWHTLSVNETLTKLATTPRGLTAAEADERRARYGPNSIPVRRGPGIFKLILRQFQNPLIYVLLIAGAVSIAVNEVIDAAFIFGVLSLNAAVGAFQEWQAETGARALQAAAKVRATVRRGGVLEELDAAELVPGDVVLLESGNATPADLHLISCIELQVDESILTGESEPVRKNPDAVLPGITPVGDRSNMLHAGSSVFSGRASAVVASTGAHTQLGRIAKSLSTQSAQPPLIARMKKFTTRLALYLTLLIFVLGAAQFARGSEVGEVFLLAVALAVSAIPEGLPVGVTIALSIASRRMARRNVIVRLLPAVEGLGACTVIATDKTGTLTVNRMTVKRLVLPDGYEVEVTGEGLELSGRLQRQTGEIALTEQALFMRMARAGVLCNESQIRIVDGEVSAIGDTVDAAFLVLGEKLGMAKVALEDNAVRVDMIPYESARKYAASFNRVDGMVEVSVKGAVELVLGMCDTADRPAITEQALKLARSGFRVLALASGRVQPTADNTHATEDPTGLQFLGLVGLIDPVRRDVPEAVQKCRSAGVQVKMVTGDHPATALAIARQLGIANDESEVITGREIAAADPESGEFRARLNAASVYARVEPEQKMAIVNSLQAEGHFVAVTGDGVNDAPALRAANIGVSMGKSGTDVARDASDLIIADDNFASIVNGIEEGRTAYDNVRKIVWLLLATAMGELMVFLLSSLTGLPIPLTAVQLLWLNVVTEGIQDVALAFERREPGVLRRRPRSPSEQILDRRMIEQVLISGSVMGFGAFMVFYWLVEVSGWNVIAASNVLLLVMVFYENIHVFNARSELRSVFHIPFSANPLVVGSAFLAQAIHIGAMFTPGLRDVLDIEPVSAMTWIIAFGVSLSALASAEVYKMYRRRIDQHENAKQPTW
jgi:Ca2+-transporting ATPase